jgi:hypothetical protein
MISNGESPLTPLAQEALDALVNALPSEEELTYEHAYAILTGLRGFRAARCRRYYRTALYAWPSL